MYLKLKILRFLFIYCFMKLTNSMSIQKRNFSLKLWAFLMMITWLKFSLPGANQPGSLIQQKGMTFDHDFGHSFPLFTSLIKKEGRIKGECIAKIVIKSHAFLLDRIFGREYKYIYNIMSSRQGQYRQIAKQGFFKRMKQHKNKMQ